VLLTGAAGGGARLTAEVCDPTSTAGLTSRTLLVEQAAIAMETASIAVAGRVVEKAVSRARKTVAARRRMKRWCMVPSLSGSMLQRKP
jgi:hypothetical protein